MTNSPGTSIPQNRAKATPPETDVPARSVTISQVVSRGSSTTANYEQQRFHDIFDDSFKTDVRDDSDYQPGRLGGAMGDRQKSPMPKPFSFGPILEEDTFLFFHYRRGHGVRVFMQAGTRAFVVAFVILVILISSPGIRDTVDSVIKAILNMH